MERKRYRLLMITTGFVPYEFSEALVNSKLVLALKNAGHEVDVITRESNQVYSTGWSEIWEPLRATTYFVTEDDTNKLKRIFEIIYCLIFFKYPLYGIRWGYKVYKLALLLNKTKRYDILLTRMPSDIPHLIGKKIHQRLKIPWIANWNDPTDNIRPLLEDKSLMKSVIVNLMVKDVFKNANFNTYPSKELWEHFNSKILHKDSTNVEIIPHIGIELDKNFFNKPDLGNEFHLCHAGNLYSGVDSEPFLKALRKLKYIDKQNFKLHLIGLTNRSFLSAAEEQQLSEDVICHNSLNYESVLSELGKYDVVVLIEAQYTKGILLLSKLSDYASVGKPVLCISPLIGVIPEYIKKFGGGLTVDNQDIQSIYEGLKKFIYQWRNNWPDKSIFLSNNLFDQFSPVRIVAQYENLFEKVSIK